MKSETTVTYSVINVTNQTKPFQKKGDQILFENIKFYALFRKA